MFLMCVDTVYSLLVVALKGNYSLTYILLEGDNFVLYADFHKMFACCLESLLLFSL